MASYCIHSHTIFIHRHALHIIQKLIHPLSITRSWFPNTHIGLEAFLERSWTLEKKPVCVKRRCWFNEEPVKPTCGGYDSFGKDTWQYSTDFRHRKCHSTFSERSSQSQHVRIPDESHVIQENLIVWDWNFSPHGIVEYHSFAFLEPNSRGAIPVKRIKDPRVIEIVEKYHVLNERFKAI